ncbi:hypothetical protein DESC_40030 [Desulfosarcina cetonica]|nr:hypothetical protein DESC_40030 [Desulfosarcina cetonica]
MYVMLNFKLNSFSYLTSFSKSNQDAIKPIFMLAIGFIYFL